RRPCWRKGPRSAPPAAWPDASMPREELDRGRPRALLVDYGGVLTTSVTTSFAAFCVANGVSPERMRGLMGAAYGSDPASAGPDAELIPSMEIGALPADEFDRRLAAILSEGLAEPLDPIDLTA